MPVYEYRCADCGAFEANRRMAECSAPTDCPDCGTPAARILSAPRLAILDATRRHAHTVNERSAHNPKVEKNHRHGPGCGCGHGPAGGASSGAMKTRTGHRPWMISH